MTIKTRFIALAGLLATSCNIDGNCTWPDGSLRCDSGPVMAEDLEGDYCTPDRGTCLRIVHRDAIDQPAQYFWINPTCGEDGTLTGGLEFSPDGSGQCFGDLGLYSASVDWTELGIRLFIDGERGSLELNFIGCNTCE